MYIAQTETVTGYPDDGLPVLHSLCGLGSLYHDSAFKALLFQLAGELVCGVDIAVVDVIIGIAAAAAVEFRPAVLTVVLGVDMSRGEFLFDVVVEGALDDIAHFVSVAAHELMTGIDISVGSYSHVLVAAAAASETLYRAGTLIEIQHKMEEIKMSALFFVDEHDLCKALILGEYGGQLLLGDSILFARVAYHRLHGYLVEALLIETEHIVCEVGIIFGKGAADVIILMAALFNKTLVLVHEQVIGALAVGSFPHTVVDFPSAVHGEYHVGHFLVDEIYLFIVQEQTVGGYGKSEVLVVLLFLGAAVLHELLHSIEVHKRLAAEEIHLKIFPVCGVFEKEIESTSARIEIHDLSAETVISRRSEAVLTAEIAVHGDKQAHSLYGSSHGHFGELFVIVLGKESLFLIKLNDLVVAGNYLLAVIEAGKLFDNAFGTFFVKGRTYVIQHIICKLVHQMNAAAVDVEDDIISV